MERRRRAAHTDGGNDLPGSPQIEADPIALNAKPRPLHELRELARPLGGRGPPRDSSRTVCRSASRWSRRRCRSRCCSGSRTGCNVCVGRRWERRGIRCRPPGGASRSPPASRAWRSPSAAPTCRACRSTASSSARAPSFSRARRPRLVTDSSPSTAGRQKRPGLVRVGERGAAIEVEVWELPVDRAGSFLARVPPPLAIGSVELADGAWVKGFVCETYAVERATDITHLGGWRAYLAATQKA